MDGYVGEIRYFPQDYAPRSWLPCNGQLLSINQYAALYSLVGTIYGGNGQTTFGLPDLRGRVPYGFGQPTNSPSVPIGTVTGTETVALAVNQLPAHAHAVQASTADATATSPSGQVFAANAANAAYTSSTGTGVMAAGGVGQAGSGLPHENRAPTLAVLPCICVSGIYPTRS